MHTGTLKKLALALIFWLAVHKATLYAQLLGPYNDSAHSTTFEVDANDVLFETGSGNGSLSLSGTGTKMFWYPGKAAFRAGSINIVFGGTNWNDANIGTYSAAFGFTTTASGSGSMALGYLTTASGNSSIATGDDTFATGTYSSTFGEGTIASGSAAAAFGNSSATGSNSTSFGMGAIASGANSTASGMETSASALDSFVVGAYNIGGGSATTWISTDRLFEVGNGTSSGYTFTPSDAFVVYKNGNAAVQGTLAVHASVRCAAGGDISMGSFTAGTAP